MGTYKSTVTLLEGMPRSKRLRELGRSASSTTSVPAPNTPDNYFEPDLEIASLIKLKGAYSFLGPRFGLVFEETPEADVASSPAHLMLRNLGTQANPNYALYTPLPLITGGDQIVNSGTPGGGGSGGGAGYLYELGDVYHDNAKTVVLRPNGQQRGEGDVLSFDSSLGVWVAIQKSSLLAGYALESYVDSEIWDSIQALNLGTASTYGVGTVASGNGGLVTGGSVYSAINDAVSSALKFQGITTTAISDGSTTNPIVINGSSYTAKKGDVVLYDGREFLWTGSAWEQLGDEVSWALKTTTISAGTGLTGGGTLAANRTISLNQDTIGKLALAATAYQKPSGGIPNSDIATPWVKVGTTQISLGGQQTSLAGLVNVAMSGKLTIGSAEIEWVAGENGNPGYLKVNQALLTTGDQIVNSGTPGGGGGGGAMPYMRDIQDVSLSATVGNGDLLQWNGSAWVNVAANTVGVTTLASASAPGLMSSADYLKLAGIANGATNVTESTVSGWGFTKNAGTVTSVKVGSTSYSPSSGVVSLPAYPTTLPASDVYAWAKAATKPSYTLDEVTDGSTRKLSDYVLKSGDTMTGDLVFSRTKGISSYDATSGGTARSLMYLSSSNNLIIGSGLNSVSDGRLYLRGTYIRFQTSPKDGSYTDAVYINDSQNVTIGSSNLASTNYRFYVSGNSYYNGTLSVVGLATLSGGATIPVNKKLTIGDAEIEWIPNSGNGYLKINKPLLTVGDQIVNSGTPGGGGGGGGAGFLYELGDVLTDSDHTVVKQYNGTDNAANNNIFAFNGSKWYALKLGSNLAISSGTLNATNTTYSNGTGLALSGGVFSITSAYQTDIANGASAYSTLTTSQAKNKVLASPSNASGAPSFRVLVAADIPSLTVSKISDIASNYVSIATANTITAKHTFSNGILLNTASSWTNSDRAIAFSADGEDANIRYYNTDATKGLAFNPNTGALRAGKFVKNSNSGGFLKADGSEDISTYVPTGRTVNGKALSSNITLSLDDVADGSTRKLANYLPLAGGTMTGNLKWNNSTALPSTTSTSYILCIDAFADGGTTKYISTSKLLGGYVLKAGDTMSGNLAICLTPSSSYPVDRTKANLIVEDDNEAATGEVRGGNIILSRGYTATANQSAGAISFYGRRLSAGYRNGVRIASVSSVISTAYDRQDLAFYVSNNSSDSTPTFEEAMRIRADKAVSMNGWLSVSRDGVYNIYINNTASDGTASGIRFQLNGTTKGGLFVNHDENLYYSIGTESTGNKVLTSVNYDDYALPLAGGTMTGSIKLTNGTYINAESGYAMCGIGSGGETFYCGPGAEITNAFYLRSGNIDLTHYKAGTNYTIWDASNSGISTKPWACSTLSVNTSLTLPNDVSILGTLTDSSTVSIAKVSTSNNIVIGGSSFAHNVNLYGTLVKFYAGGTTAIGTVSSTGLGVTGTVTASGIGTFDRVVLSNSGAVSHIEFTRAGWNYVSVPTDGVIAFNTGGSGSANTTMAVTPDGIRPGTKAVHSCGLPTAYWGSIYGKDLYLGGDTHNTAAGSIIFSEKLDSQRNGFKIAPVHATSANRINLVFYRSNNGTSPYAASWTTFMTLSYDGKVTIAGSLTTSGDQVISSDAALKKNLKDLNLTVEQIAQLPAVTFDWKDGRGSSFGTVAQSVLPIFPQAVRGEEGNYSVVYGQGGWVFGVKNAQAIVEIQKHETEQDKEIRELNIKVKEQAVEISRLKELLKMNGYVN